MTDVQITSRGTASPPGAASMKYKAASIAQNYQVRLEVLGDKQLTSSGVKIFPIIANLPERYNMDFTSNWSSPFARSDAASIIAARYGSFAGEAATAVAAVAGVSTRLKSQSVQVWDSTSPMSFSVQMIFNAETNSATDIRDRHRALLKLCAPSEGALGVLIQPGPTIAGATANALHISDDSRRITLVIGSYLKLENVVITSVSSDISTLCTADGIPINMTINIGVTSFYGCFTSEDIDRMFMV